MHCQDLRGRRREQAPVDARQGQPLVVDDVGVRRRAAGAHHRGRCSARPIARRAKRPGRHARRAPVEALVHPIALRIGHLAVHEVRREQLDIRPGAGQSRAQRAVEWWRLRRRIDDLNPHKERLSAMDLSFCVVNTSGRDHLVRCLEAIRDTLPAGLEFEVLVLDNASEDGSAAVAGSGTRPRAAWASGSS